MSKQYETVIGLEVHVELATRTKIFCGCSTAFGGAPNTHTCPVCTGMPGSLPVLNKQVVEYAAAGRVVKEEGKENDLLERIAADSAFGMTMEQLQAIMKPENFVGRSPEQTVEFITEYVQPVLDENKDILGMKAEINV